MSTSRGLHKCAPGAHKRPPYSFRVLFSVGDELHFVRVMSRYSSTGVDVSTRRQSLTRPSRVQHQVCASLYDRSSKCRLKLWPTEWQYALLITRPLRQRNSYEAIISKY